VITSTRGIVIGLLLGLSLGLPTFALSPQGGLHRRNTTDALFRTFLIYVVSSGRPPHELVRPSLAELDEAFINEFEGMTVEPVSLDDLKAASSRMTADILAKLDDRAMSFLLSLHDGEPDFGAIGLPQAAELPAVRWKLLNLQKLKDQNPAKHAEQRREIENIVADMR